MNDTKMRQFILAKPEVVEEFPFAPDAPTFKVCGKMFALLFWGEWKGREGVPKLNLKCDPEEALALRDVFESVIPGYHMNKKHWNTVVLDGTIPPGEVERMIDRSYGLVVKGLRKIERRALEIKYGEQLLYQ